MPMHPRPSAETSRPWLPSLRLLKVMMLAPCESHRRGGAAVDAESCAGHEIAQWTCEEAYGRRDVARLSQSRNRLLQDVLQREILADFRIVAAQLHRERFEPGLDEWRINEPRHDAVGGHARAGQSLREAKRQIVESGLRRAVGPELRVSRDGIARRDLDNATPSTIAHRRYEGLC